jgi:hypothetical protein
MVEGRAGNFKRARSGLPTSPVLPPPTDHRGRADHVAGPMFWFTGQTSSDRRFPV